MSDEDRINSYNLRRATKRLNREINIISKDPIPGIDLRANEDNILEWHFVIHGKEDTPYYGGMYHGKLIFPSNFPFSPPKIIFLTPNGRFKTNERICFSLSDFHPEEWKPAFTVTTILQGVTDFMHDTTETIGSIETSESVKRQLAESSSIHNGKDAIFCRLFPKLCGRKVTDSEDSSNESSPSKTQEAIPDTNSPVREKTTSPDEITLPPTHLTPVLIEITPPSPPAEITNPEETLLMLKENVVPRVESSSPREIIKSSGEESRIPSDTPQEQRTITPPTHTTPSETRPADNPPEKRKLHSPPIKRPPGATDSQRNLSPSDEKIHGRTASPEPKAVREKTPSPDEITPPPRIQSPTSTKVPLPSTHLTSGPSEIASLPPHEETAKHGETLLEIIRSPGDTLSQRKPPPIPEIPSPEREISPNEEKSPFGNKSTQEERDIAPPPHTTPSVTRTIHERVRPVRTRSKRGVGTLAQNESQRPFIISQIYPKQQDFEPNPPKLECIELEERPVHYFGEYRKLPSPPIRPPGTTHSQRNLLSSPKEIIPRQTPTPEREICPDIELAYPSIDVITPVDGESLDRQEADVDSLRIHKFQRNTKKIHFTIGALVVFLLLILGMLLIALLFILTQFDYNREQTWTWGGKLVSGNG